jgi:AcrR family transcriptional regulator
MKDIIRETGLSQGGIYRYYENIDEILVEVINRNSMDNNYIQIIDDLIENSNTAVAAVQALLSFLDEYINTNATTLGKFHFEIIELIAYEPKRMNTISKLNVHVNTTQHFINCLFKVIRRGISSKEFKPILPLDDILAFISTSIDGIVLNSIFYRCYGLPKPEYGFDVICLIDTLENSVFHLLSLDTIKNKNKEKHNNE